MNRQTSTAWRRLASDLRASRRHAAFRRLRCEALEPRTMLATIPLVMTNSPLRVLIPTQEAYDDAGLDWTGGAEPFDDSTWTSGVRGAGYEIAPSSAYAPYIGVNVEAEMLDNSATAYVRAPFSVAVPADLTSLTLRLRYDDGFIVWINGTEVLRRNALGAYPSWSTGAAAAHSATSSFSTFDVSLFLGLLQPGTNVLAIRGLNLSASDSDFLIQAELEGKNDRPPTANDDTLIGVEGVAVALDVLSNDAPDTSPLDAGSLRVVSPPGHGTASVNPDGTLSYTPLPGYLGSDSLTYTVRDTAEVVGPGTTMRTLVSANAPAKVLIPTDDELGRSWTGGNEPFNDTAWRSGTLGVGYDVSLTSSNYGPYYDLNIPDMRYVNASVYVRVPFAVDHPGDVQQLTLRMRYDDGFVAYLNGVEVARANAPSIITYNAEAPTYPPESQAILFEDFDLSSFAGLLEVGDNVLAIQGLNNLIDSSDLLIQPELVASVTTRGRVSNVATVNLNVLSAAPSAADDVATTLEQTPIVVPVVDNDTVGPLGFPLNLGSVTIGSSPNHGTASVDSASGAITYIPQAGFIGQDSFTYTIRDTSPQEGIAGPIQMVRLDSVWKYLPLGPDQGAASIWAAGNFDDALWPQGTAELGYGDGDEATVLPADPVGTPTVYFRRTFDIADPSAIYELTLALFRDDGAIVYINGVEVARSNMPAGPITFHTLAPQFADDDGTSPQIFTWSNAQVASLLTPGTNTIAAEVHQSSGTSSDLSFNLFLGATTFTPAGRASNSATVTVTVAPRPDRPVGVADAYIINEDQSLIATAGGTIAGVLDNDLDSDHDPLSALLLAGPAHGAIQLAADGSFTYVPAANYFGTDGFFYRVDDGELLSEATAVLITINAVDDPPTVVPDEFLVDQNGAVIIGDGGGTSSANFAEEFNGSLGNAWQSSAGILPSESLQPWRGETVTFRGGLTTAFSTVDGASSLRISTANVPTWSRYGMVTNAALPADNLVLEARVNTLDQVGNHVDGLFELWVLSHSDHSKYVRLGFFGDQYNANRTWTFSTNRDAFRIQSFNYASNTWYKLRITQLPDATLNVSIWDDAGANRLVGYTFPYNLASLGSTFDVGVSQWIGGAQPPYSALSAVDYVRATPASTTQALVPAGAVWRYLDNGSNQGTTWRERTFDDTAWKSGPAQLGYGEGDEATVVSYGTNANNKFVTTYFRHHFSVADAGRVIAINLALRRDDGAAVYLNGVQIARDNLSATASYNTLATQAADDGDSFLQFMGVSPSLLRSGDNVLAVEVHQNSASSSDLSFDLELVATFDSRINVLANDSDPEGAALTAELVSNPSHGTMVFHIDGTASYTPAAGFVGDDIFTYRAYDGQLYSEPTIVAIHVAHSPPTARADQYTTNEDTALVAPVATGLLANDFDPLGFPMTAVLVAGPTHGALALASDGSFYYLPEANFFGTDAFTYRVRAAGTSSVSTTVTLAVTAVNDAPAAAADVYSMYEGQTFAATQARHLGGSIRPGESRLLPIPSSSKLFYDSVRDRLYARVAGQLYRYDVLNDAALSSFALATTYGDGDISADAAAIYFTETEAIGSLGYVRKVNLDNGTIASISYVRGEYEGGGVDLAIGATGLGLFSGSFFGSGDVPLRRIDTVTDTLSIVGSVWEQESWFSSSDKSLLVHLNGAVSSYSMGTVDGVTLQGIAAIDTYTPFSGGGSVSRGGSLVAIGCCGGARIYSRNMQLVRTIAGVTGGHAFDPTRDILFAVDTSSASDQIVAFDTNTWQEISRIDLGNTAGGAIGSMSISANGQLAFVSTTSGIRMVDVSQLPVAGSPPGIGVLNNDVDVESLQLNAMLAQAPSHGTLTFHADGTFVYTPNAGFVGTDTFHYRASDGQADSPSVAVTIVVRPTPVDLTGDGIFNRNDMAIVAANYGRTSGATRGQGDLDHDGAVTLSDVAWGQAMLGSLAPAGSPIAAAYAPQSIVAKATSAFRAKVVDAAIGHLSAIASRRHAFRIGALESVDVDLNDELPELQLQERTLRASRPRFQQTDRPESNIHR